MIREWLRKWLAGKIQINITYVVEGVETSTIIRPKKNDSKILNISNKSNFRFCSYEVQDPGEPNSRTYYYTEVYTNGKWDRVEGTWFLDKNKAIDAHLNVLKGVTLLTAKQIDSVLWEGLDEQETITWANLQKTNENS